MKAEDGTNIEAQEGGATEQNAGTEGAMTENNDVVASENVNEEGAGVAQEV